MRHYTHIIYVYTFLLTCLDSQGMATRSHKAPKGKQGRRSAQLAPCLPADQGVSHGLAALALAVADHRPEPPQGCLYEFGVLSVGVATKRAQLLGVYIMAPWAP